MEILNDNILRLEVYDVNKRILGVLTDNTEYTVDNLNIDESINDTTKINFKISSKNEKAKYVINENLIKYNGEYYIIKKPTFNNLEEEFEVECEHEALRLKERLVGKMSEIAESPEVLITKVLSDTDWVFGGTDIPEDKKRHLETDEMSVFANLIEIANSFNARLKFSIDTSTGKEIKSVSLYANVVNRGRYIKNDRDLNSVDISYDSSEMVTRLYVYGRTDNGTGREVNMMAAHPKSLPYVEDFSYFKDLGYTDSDISANKDLFIKELILRENSLYTSREVYDFALEEIKRLCYPKVEAEVSILDLSCDNRYMKEPIQIGEVIHVIDTKTNLMISANIISISRNYENPLDVNIGISNVIEKSSTLKRMAQSADVVQKIIDSESDKIHGTYIREATIGSAHLGEAIIENIHIKDGIIDNTKINKASIQEAILENAIIDSVHIKEGAVDNIHIKKGAIDKVHIKEGSIENVHIGEGAINSAKIDKASIQEAIIEEGIIGTVHIQDAAIDNTKIKNASIDSAKIKDLDANKINFGTAKGDLIDVQTLLSKFISGDSAQLLNLNANNTSIANAIIKDAMIDTVNASKINAGQINTNLVNLLSANGNLIIKDNTIQIKDGTRTRVQIGLDGNNDYSINVWDKSGNLMFNSNGITDKAIKSKIIRDDMVSDTANISGGKLNIGSVIESINNDNTKTLKSSKVNLDSENQTLEVAFNSLRTNLDSKESRNLLTKSDVEKSSELEFLMYADIAPIIDRYGSVEYTISFDLKSSDITNSNKIEVYCQNGSGARYNIGTRTFDVTTEYQRFSFTRIPLILNNSETQSYLAFFGGYNTGNRPIVKNVKIELGKNNNPVYSQAPEDIEEKIQSNTTSINIEQGKINTLISENSIIKSNVSTLGGKFDNLKIGGRNLIIRTGEVLNQMLDSNGNLASNISSSVMKDLISVYPNEVLTFQKENSEHFRWNWYDSNKVFISRKADNNNVFQWNVPSNAHFIRVSYPNIGNVKLERGNKATDYTPAPEDIDSSITTLNNNYSSLNQTVGGLSSTVGNHTTSISNVNTLANSKAKTFVSTPTTPYQIGDIWVQGTSGDLMRCKVARATGSYVASDWEKASKYTDDTKANTVESNLNATITRVASTESSISQLNNQIALKVESNEVNNTVNNAINSIQVGGRNLAFRDTIVSMGGLATLDSSLYSDNGTLKVERKVGDANGGFHFDKLIKYKPNSNYVVNFKMKVETGTIDNIYFHNGQNLKNTKVYIDNVIVGNVIGSNISTSLFDDNKYHYVRMEYTTPSNLVDSSILNNHTFFQPNKSLSTIPYLITISEFKVEEGNKATSWTPAIEDIDSAISSIDTRVKSAELKITDSAIISTVSSTINNAVNNIQIGGRNLFKNSGFNNGLTDWNIYGVTGTHSIVSDSSAKSGKAITFVSNSGGIYQRTQGIYPVGTTLVVSGYFKSPTANAGLTINFEGSSTSAKSFTSIVANTYTYFEYSVVVANTWDALTFYGRAGVTYTLKDLQLERGNKATDWTPSQEEIDSFINNAKTEAISSANTSTDNKLKNYSTTAQINSEISQLNNKIALKVEGSEVTTTVNNAITDLEIGGRNLWRSGDFSSLDGIGLSHGSIVDITADNLGNFKKAYYANTNGRVTFNLIPLYTKEAFGQTYTFSCWIKYKNVVLGANAWNGLNVFKNTTTYRDTNGNVSGASYPQAETFTGTSDWRKITWTYTYHNPSYTEVKSSVFIGLESATSGEMWVTGIKVEKGNKATDWSPAPEDIDASISSIDTRVKAAELKITDSAIISTVSSTINTTVNSAVNNIQVGGRNLVKNTKMDTVWNSWISSRATTSKTNDGVKLTSLLVDTQSAMVSDLTINPKLGENFTITANVRGNYPTLELYLLATTGTNYRVYYNANTNNTINTTTFTKISATFEFNNTNTNPTNRLFIGGIPTVVGQWLEVERGSVKVEKGNKPTDWTPAPEDVDSSITNAKTEAINSANTSTDNKLKNYSTTSQINSEISQLNNKIALKVESNQVNTSITNAINNIEIGGRNLARNTKTFKGGSRDLGFWSSDGSYTFTNDSDGFTIAKATSQNLTANAIKSIYSNRVNDVKKGDVYTYSVWVKVDDVSAWDFTFPYIFEVYDSSGTRIQYQDVNITLSTTNRPTPISGEWFLFTSTHTITVDNPTSIGARLTLFKNGAISFKKFKIERGNKATDWTPAPEDVDSSIDNIQVGGRNLATFAIVINGGGASTLDKSQYTINGSLTLGRDTGDGNGGFHFDSLIAYEPNSKYVVSFNAKLLNGTIKNIYFHAGKSLVDTKVYIDNVHIGGIGKSIATTKFNDGLYHNVRMEYTTPSAIPTTSHTYFQPNKGLATDIYSLHITSFKVEKGNKPTDWTPAPEDVNNSITNAQNSANTANSLLSDIANDNKITAVEKISIKKEWDIIVGEKPAIESNANNFAITTEKTNYINAYNSLNVYITPLLSSLSTTSTIVGTTFRANFKNYYDKRQLLLNAIAIENKSLANEAQSSINNLEVGATNLLRNTAYNDYSYWGGSSDGDREIESGGFGQYNTMSMSRSGYTGTTRFQLNQNVSSVIEANQTYTMSGYVYVDNSIPLDAPTTSKNDFHLRYYNSSNQLRDVGSFDFATLEKNKWIKFSSTFTIGSDIDKSKNNHVVIFNIGKNGKLIFSRLKLEKGTKATDWTPSPEDVDSAISSVNSKISSLATKSELTLAESNLKASFKTTGGNNIIRNSTGRNGTAFWTTSATSIGTGIDNASGGINSKYLYIDNGTNTSERYAFSKRFKMKPNTKYTLSGYFKNFTKCPSFDVFVLLSTSLLETDITNNYNTTINVVSTQNTNAAWKKYSLTFTTGSSVKSGLIRIDNNGFNINGTGDNRVCWQDLMLNEGEEQLWTQHPSEMYEGNTIIDESGIRINHVNSSTYTKIDSESFRINGNDGKLIAQFGEDGSASVDVLYANKIVSNSITPIVRNFGTMTYEIDASGLVAGKYQSLSHAMAQFCLDVGLETTKAYGGFILSGTNIELKLTGASTHSSDFTLKDIQGSGGIKIYFEKGGITGKHSFEGISCPLEIKRNMNFNSRYDDKEGKYYVNKSFIISNLALSAKPMLSIINCSKAYLTNISFFIKPNVAYGRGYYTPFIVKNSTITMEEMDFGGCDFPFIIENSTYAFVDGYRHSYENVDSGIIKDASVNSIAINNLSDRSGSYDIDPVYTDNLIMTFVPSRAYSIQNGFTTEDDLTVGYTGRTNTDYINSEAYIQLSEDTINALKSMTNPVLSFTCKIFKSYDYNTFDEGSLARLACDGIELGQANNFDLTSDVFTVPQSTVTAIINGQKDYIKLSKINPNSTSQLHNYSVRADSIIIKVVGS